jgi:hypothetical protein
MLQDKLGLANDPNVPLLAVISRMDVQKGIDLAFTALKSMKNVNFQAVILGTGDPKLEEAARAIANGVPRKDQSGSALRCRACPSDLCRRGYAADAVALRTVRAGADDRDALWLCPGGARGGRIEGYGQTQHHRIYFREGASHVVDGRDQNASRHMAIRKHGRGSSALAWRKIFRGKPRQGIFEIVSIVGEIILRLLRGWVSIHRCTASDHRRSQ